MRNLRLCVMWLYLAVVAACAAEHWRLAADTADALGEVAATTAEVAPVIPGIGSGASAVAGALAVVLIALGKKWRAKLVGSAPRSESK